MNSLAKPGACYDAAIARRRQPARRSRKPGLEQLPTIAGVLIIATLVPTKPAFS